MNKIGDIIHNLGRNWRHYILTNDHREDLLGDKWLNDYHIHAAQQLIKLEPELQHIGGLQRLIPE